MDPELTPQVVEHDVHLGSSVRQMVSRDFRVVTEGYHGISPQRRQAGQALRVTPGTDHPIRA